MICSICDDVIEDEIPPHQRKKKESKGLEELFSDGKKEDDGLPF